MKFKNWLEIKDINENTDFGLYESTSARYSVEINYKTTQAEATDGFVKIVLGFISAALKARDYHIKQVLDEKPYRIVISSRNWDDGEWATLLYFHPEWNGGKFIICTGFYQKDTGMVAVKTKEEVKANNAAEITRQVIQTMEDLKNKPDRHQEKLKGVPMKRGPK